MNIDKILDSVRGLSPISYEKNLKRELNKALAELTSDSQLVSKLEATQKQRDEAIKICGKFEKCAAGMASHLEGDAVKEFAKVRKEFAKFKKQA